jgi:hypothetical protein
LPTNQPSLSNSKKLPKSLPGGGAQESVAAVIGGVVLAGALLVVIWKIVSAAVDNGMDWLIHTFRNDQAAKRVEQKWRNRE